MGLCRPHSPDRGGPGAPLPGPGWTHCGQQRAEGVRRGDEAGRRCTGQGPGGSVPVTLRARPPPRSGTVQGLKLPARVAARVQGSQIPLGGPRVGGVQERERERVASTPGWGPGRGRLRGPGHSAGGGDSREPVAPRVREVQEVQAGSAAGHRGATARQGSGSEARGPSAPLATLSFAAHRLQEARPGPASLYAPSLWHKHALPPFPGLQPRGRGDARPAWSSQSPSALS